MRRFAIGAAAAGLVGLAAAFPLSAAMTVSPFAGAWHWDKEASQTVAGMPTPQEVIWEIKNYSTKGHNDYNRVQWSLTITYPNGQQRDEGFTGAFDGHAYPIKGRDDGATRSYKVMPDGSLESEFKSPKTNVTSTSTCTLSDDNNKMTCKGMVPDAQGKDTQYVAVFDRIVSKAEPIQKKKP